MSDPGWSSSPSFKGQPSRCASAVAIIIFPLPATPVTMRIGRTPAISACSAVEPALFAGIERVCTHHACLLLQKGRQGAVEQIADPGNRHRCDSGQNISIKCIVVLLRNSVAYRWPDLLHGGRMASCSSISPYDGRDRGARRMQSFILPYGCQWRRVVQPPTADRNYLPCAAGRGVAVGKDDGTPQLLHIFTTSRARDQRRIERNGI